MHEVTRRFMLLCMRTTVDLNDELFRRAKRQAAEEGLTLRELIEDAVRTRLSAMRAAPRPYKLRLKTYGGGLQPGVDLEDWAALRERMDGAK